MSLSSSELMPSTSEATPAVIQPAPTPTPTATQVPQATETVPKSTVTTESDAEQQALLEYAWQGQTFSAQADFCAVYKSSHRTAYAGINSDGSSPISFANFELFFTDQCGL